MNYRSNLLLSLLCLLAISLLHCSETVTLPPTEVGHEASTEAGTEVRTLDAGTQEKAPEPSGVKACGEVDYMTTKCPGAAAMVSCVKEAFENCTPMKVKYTSPTLEGDPIFYELSITGKKANGDCLVTQVKDNRQDRHGAAPGIKTSSCRILLIGKVFGTGCEIPRTDECK